MTFDRDARERAKAWLEKSTFHSREMYGCVACYRGEPCNERDVYEAARWAVQITEGDDVRVVREWPLDRPCHWDSEVVWETGE